MTRGNLPGRVPCRRIAVAPVAVSAAGLPAPNCPRPERLLPSANVPEDLGEPLIEIPRNPRALRQEDGMKRR